MTFKLQNALTVLCDLFTVFLVFRLSSKIVGCMGPTLINAMTKMMCFTVLYIGVQFILDGLVSVYRLKIALIK